MTLVVRGWVYNFECDCLCGFGKNSSCNLESAKSSSTEHVALVGAPSLKKSAGKGHSSTPDIPTKGGIALSDLQETFRHKKKH